jgi:hypothetical protein
MKGRPWIRQVTKAGTGLPGRPMEPGLTPSLRIFAEGQRLAGLDGDLPHIEFAFGLDGRLDVIFLADRNAAAGHDQIVVGRRRRSASRVASSVSSTAEVTHFAAHAFEQGAQA